MSEQDLYGSGYYEIQKLNSQLINYQRTLAKSNAHLQTLLDEVRQAKYTIEALERDTLTGLLTEKAFYQRAKSIFEENPNKNSDICIIDIEQFKTVNEVFGPKVGDRFLMDLALCLTEFKIDDSALLTRARADTFFALLSHTDFIMDEFVDKIRIFLKNYPLPMRLQAKIGIYHVDNRDLSIARMCDRAIIASESVKGNYRIRYNEFNDAMYEKMMQEQKIVNTMVESLNKEEFCIYLQPKIDMEKSKIIGAEALVRWKHPELGLISPKDFIPIFEKNGFIYAMDTYVWRKSCELLRTWKDNGIEEIPISVNVSRADIYQGNLLPVLLNLIQEYGLQPKQLHLEITETAYTNNSEQLIEVVKRLKEKGFIVEMDDFGSGYSSLNALSELPIDVLKLDLKFVNGAEHNQQQQKVIECITNLADALHLQVVAEGVETLEQEQLLKRLGCRYAQGYLYGHPMPAGEFYSLI